MLACRVTVTVSAGLIAAATTDFDSAKVNNVNVTAQTRERRPRQGPIESVSDLNQLFQNLCALDDKGARQYIRACEAYRVAVSLLSENPTLAMFMLVTSVECLSNTFERRKCLHLKRPGSGNYDRFRDFISSNLPADLEAEKSDTMFPELLKRCYDIRSAFTHGGKPLSLAAGLADRVEKKFAFRGRTSSPNTKPWMVRESRTLGPDGVFEKAKWRQAGITCSTGSRRGHAYATCKKVGQSRTDHDKGRCGIVIAAPRACQ
jgi:hypothetical protein